MSTTGDAKVTKKPNIMRRMYDWVLHWADTPYGAPVLFVLAFAESSFFPIPPDVLLIALALSARKKAFRFALICTLGSISGGILGYGIGKFLYVSVGEPIIGFYGYEEKFESMRDVYNKNSFLFILAAALTPIPYKVFTIAAGMFDTIAFGSTFWSMIAASAVGRTIRFFLVATLIWKFGPPIKGFIDRYFNWLCLAFLILLVGGFLVIT